MIQFASVLTLVLVVAACGEKQNNAPENQSVTSGKPESAATNEVYTGTGRVQLINGDQVAIAHGPIQSIGWPAMTMTFTAPPNIAGRVKAGAKVDFSFQKNGSDYVLTSVKQR